MELTKEEAQVVLQIIRATAFKPDEYETLIRPLIMKLQAPEEKPKKK